MALRQKNCRITEATVICFVVPAAVAFIGAFVDFYTHGFHVSYAVSGAVFSVITNLICSSILVAATAAVRGPRRRSCGKF
ncbi:MAG: hypothetical protein IKT79_04325 [Akkermansia sp.]|nr:hypothetical protein [Akkermansia sp.]